MAKYPVKIETAEGAARIDGEADFYDPLLQPHFLSAGCYLQAAPLDIHALGALAPKWNAVFDNVIDSNAIAAIPAELGITNPVNGSTARLTFSDAPGVWLYEFTCALSGVADATIKVNLLAAFGFAQAEFGPVITAQEGDTWALSGHFAVPADAVGAFGSFSINTEVAATANPYTVTPIVVLTRIG